jgi:hypothetical protein
MSDHPADDAVQKRKALQQQFRTLPETIIIGAVGANGPGAGRVPPEKSWSLHPKLVAWRELGRRLNTEPLTVTKAVNDAELTTLQNTIKAETVVAFKAKLALTNSFGIPWAELIAVLPDCEDQELSAFLKEYSKPVQFSDPQFGLFKLNKRVNWFEGQAEWCGVSVSLALKLDHSNNPDPVLQTARELWKAMEAWRQEVNAFAVSQLLDLKNDTWLADGEEEVTAQRFVETMRLEAISVYPDGRFVFWHNDGNLFWGHSIQISGSLSQGLTDADIPG